MQTDFLSLFIDAKLVQKLTDRNILNPTPIQQQAIPALLNGDDVIARSQTGTGKTLAYLLPIVQQIDSESKELQAVIIVPTRELGVQISREIELLTRDDTIRSQSLIGGAALSRQVEKLRLHPHIVVGTPGRIHELIQMRKLKMHAVRTIVIDEVDQVFDLGSINETGHIINSARKDRQIVMFSATISEKVANKAMEWMKKPFRIEINPEAKTAESIEHLYFACERREKIDLLRRILRHFEPRAAIVFINEMDTVAELVEKLNFLGFAVASLYGESDKQQRSLVLNSFRAGKINVLIATDVAARGLDLQDVTHVIQFDPATDADHYVHRAGRTGRMGKSGTSISIVTYKQEFIIDKFEKELGITISAKKMYGGRILDDKQPGRLLPVNISSASSETSSTVSPSYRKVRTSKTPQKKPAVPKEPQKVKVNRERNNKNKGAPRWLKEKRQKND